MAIAWYQGSQRFSNKMHADNGAKVTGSVRPSATKSPRTSRQKYGASGDPSIHLSEADIAEYRSTINTSSAEDKSHHTNTNTNTSGSTSTSTKTDNKVTSLLRNLRDDKASWNFTFERLGALQKYEDATYSTLVRFSTLNLMLAIHIHICIYIYVYVYVCIYVYILENSGNVVTCFDICYKRVGVGYFAMAYSLLPEAMAYHGEIVAAYVVNRVLTYTPIGRRINERTIRGLQKYFPAIKECKFSMCYPDSSAQTWEQWADRVPFLPKEGFAMRSKFIKNQLSLKHGLGYDVAENLRSIIMLPLFSGAFALLHVHSLLTVLPFYSPTLVHTAVCYVAATWITRLCAEKNLKRVQKEHTAKDKDAEAKKARLKKILETLDKSSK
ncbi:hypothetical protein RFI_23075 [Reticulomyxa filosa]|uniref:Uncharacterized protein n=1 Tax=Reticulomyxa filosa TaxID=46433 RepID=X6MLG4_RETFI|nr:hypothetical protein RFI_23075 [Reticulomyxa filosa]|eukprot:ETO14292.1 hypothetical protein RFI_23075 [Reticulomyxa filosa]